jgi:hypothetical protein
MSDRSRLIRDIAITAGLPCAAYLLLSHEGIPPRWLLPPG